MSIGGGGYYPGGRRSILVHLERVQSKENKIYSANDVADSNAGVNGNDSNTSYSNNKGNDHLFSDGKDLGELF